MTTLLSAVVALTAASTLTAQISYTQDFDSQTAGLTPPSGFTGNFTTWADATTCSGTGVGIRRNLWASVPTGEVGSFIGISTGNPASFNFDYKVHVWAANTVPATAPWGTIQVQVSSLPTGPWTTIGTITDEAQVAGCISRSFPFTPAPGAVFFRFNCTRTGGDNWWCFDNIDVQETVPCSGTPNPGNTVGPAGACLGQNFTLSLQNVVAGTGVTYQWEESTVSGTGPWTPITGANAKTLVTSQSVSKWYRCNVTCATGPASAFSNSLAVPVNPAALPEDWSAGVVDPNCWSVQQIAGVGLPLYNPVSANGIGTGSVQFDGWTFGATTESSLTSPVLSASPGGQFVIFDAAGASWFTSVDQVFVEESNDGGTTWTNVVTLDNAAAGGVLNTTTLVNPADWVPTATDWVNLFYPISAGTDRIRFRWDSAFGNNIYLDNVNITSNPPAFHQTIGTGCYSVDNPETIAELFADAPSAKAALDGNSLSFINTGNGYLALWNVGGGSAYVAPTAPTVQAVGDEGVATITPSLVTPSPNGPVTQWTIHANGALTAGPVSNPAGFLSTLDAIGAAANLGFWSFHDFNEATAGQVVTEEVGSMLYVTWDAVGGFGQPTDLSTFQFQVNMATGDVSIVWVSMHSVDVELNFVGATLAGVEPTPVSSVLSTATPFVMTRDQLPMELSVVGRPINGGPAANYTVSNLPEFFPGANFSTLAIVFGFTLFPGGIDLGPGPFDIGAPGCNGYTTPDVLVIIGLVPFAPVTFPIAWNIPVAPGTLYMQAASQFSPNTLPNGQNAGGIIVSNALEIFIENF